MAQLTMLISEVCASGKIALSAVDAVAVSAGPGSYTGLRIGTGTAKGICHALGKPLIAVNTLEAMIAGIRSAYRDPELLFCPLLDARRMEVYTMVSASNGQVLVPQMAYVIAGEAFSFVSGPCVFFGPGLEKSVSFLPAHAIADASYTLSAVHMHGPAAMLYNTGDFADISYFEPEYVKEFYTPVKK